MKHYYNSEKGIATLVALIMVGMLTLIGLAALSTSDDEVLVAGNEMTEARTFYSTESGLDIAASALQEDFDTTGNPPTVRPNGDDSINGCYVTWETKDLGPAEYKTLSVGNLAGLHGTVTSFAATATATNTLDQAKVVIAQTYEAGLVPIFQFAVFYEDDLEFSPGSDMTMVGRIHSNGDMWVESGTTLKMDSYVSAHEEIFHGKKGGGIVGAGDVQIKNAKGKYVSMKQGAGWLDSNDAWWKDSAMARWDGRVQDEEMAQPEIDMNLAGTNEPHNLIERAAGGNNDSYENKATLKFIDNQAFQLQGSSWVDVTADMTAKGIITYTADKFYDQRELQFVDVMDLNVQKLYEEAYAPANGVIYFSDADGGATEYPALRLTNAAAFGSGMTIASENPVYTLGNFNKDGKKPVSILSDALTYLSGAWDDTKGALPKTDRSATSTIVNCSFLTGALETTGLSYSGGIENLGRLLEDWTGKVLTWKGSAGKLWNSLQALGVWSTLYYSEPRRNWSYDTDYDDPNNLPPLTPVARVFQRTGWQQQHVSYRTSLADSL